MRSALLLSITCLLAVAPGSRGRLTAAEAEPPTALRMGYCPTEPSSEFSKMPMAGDGWDGPGQNAVTLTWRVEGATSQMGAEQRTAIINALQAWANVVQIHFVETAVSDDNAAIDFTFATGDHSAIESQEAGDADCPFDGINGALAHAGFPPGVSTPCIAPMAETFAGNVHFDDDENWELDDRTGADGWMSLTYAACHEIGHALGLTHSTVPDAVMEANLGSDDAFPGLQEDDIANIQAGYAAGVGTVTTLNGSGVWVSWSYVGVERGTFEQPFNTIAEGVAGIPPGSAGLVLHVTSGTYTGAPTISQNMVIQPESGIVTLTQ